MLNVTANVWERNPFTWGRQAGPQAQPSLFGKLFMTTWLNDGGKEVISVQNSETNEVQQIALEPNYNNMRLIELHLNANPRFVEAIISDGKRQGTVKFRLDVQPPPVTPPMAQRPNNGATPHVPNAGEVASQRLPRSPANAPNAQTPGSPATAPTNQRPAYRIRRGVVPMYPDAG
jgi:hypothetical protein